MVWTPGVEMHNSTRYYICYDYKFNDNSKLDIVAIEMSIGYFDIFEYNRQVETYAGMGLLYETDEFYSFHGRPLNWIMKYYHYPKYGNENETEKKIPKAYSSYGYSYYNPDKNNDYNKIVLNFHFYYYDKEKPIESFFEEEFIDKFISSLSRVEV